MKIEKTIEVLLHYYEVSRGTGHTTLMKEGTNNYNGDFFLVSNTIENSRVIEHKENCKNESISTIGDEIIGSDMPIIFDNSGLIDLLSKVYNRFDELNEENEKLRCILKDISNKANSHY